MKQKNILIIATLIVSICYAQTPKTEPYVPETPSWPKNTPKNWPIYHLVHPTFTHDSPFDPNPAFFYKGGWTVSSSCVIIQG